MNKCRDTAGHSEQMVAMRAQLWRLRQPACFADATPESEAAMKSQRQTTSCPQRACQAFGSASPASSISTSLRHTQFLHFTIAGLNNSLRLYQPACQLLSAQSLLRACLFRGQGSATMTTRASDCRPPINTSDTCVCVYVGGVTI